MRSIAFIIFSLIVLIYLSCDKIEITSKQSESFIKFYGGPSLDYGVDVKQTNDGGYAVLGTISTPDNGTDMCLILTDEYGNSLSNSNTKYFGGNYDDKGKCLRILDDGGLILMGSYQDTITGTSDIFLVKTSSSGVSIWTKIIRQTGNQEAFDLQITSSGDLLIIGYTENYTLNSITPVSVAANQKDIFQLLLNSDGDSILQPHPIGFVNDDIGHGIQSESDGYIIVGNTKSRPVGTTQYRSFIVKTNLRGSINSEFKTLFETEMDYKNHIRVLPDNNYLISGTVVNNSVPNICLMKIDHQNSEIIWEKTFNDLPDSYCTGLEVDNNEILILGTRKTAGSTSNIVFIKTDLNGGILNLSEYGLSGQMEGLGFDITDDNGYIITGSNVTGDNSVITLIKTRNNGEF
jgi:hypothetical protein